jgi:hypothetical protein
MHCIFEWHEPHAGSARAAPQPRRNVMEHSMKKLLVLVALGGVLAAPAFAQQAPNARQHAATSQPQWSNNNTNPDFQLGGER